MGWAHKTDIERAGKHLLKILAVKGIVPYSRFYDGTDEAEEKLLTGMGYPDPEQHDHTPDSPASYMDHAVGQLEGAGLVTTRPTGKKLADGEPGYEIELTGEGRLFVKSRRKFRYRDMDL